MTDPTPNRQPCINPDCVLERKHVGRCIEPADRQPLCDTCLSRVSFAFGNAVIDNPAVTEEMAEDAVRALPCPVNRCRTADRQSGGDADRCQEPVLVGDGHMEPCWNELPCSKHPEPGGEHVYISTACQHGQHARCRRVCKFCPAQCRCECAHPDGEQERASMWEVHTCNGKPTTECAACWAKAYEPLKLKDERIARLTAQLAEQQQSYEETIRKLTAQLAERDAEIKRQFAQLESHNMCVEHGGPIDTAIVALAEQFKGRGPFRVERRNDEWAVVMEGGSRFTLLRCDSHADAEALCAVLNACGGAK